jgi:hypothetical protein
MDIRAILKARGLSDENIETLATNPAYSGILEGFVQEAEEGKTAMLKAQEIENNLKTWNQNEVIPYVRKADEKVAVVQGKLAAQSAYLKTMKDQGYEIPDALLEAGPAPNPVVTPASSNTRDYSEDIMMSAKANMALISMSERARDLLGHGLDVENEYEDFQKNKRPQENLRGYITRKYDLDTLSAKREADKKTKYEEGLREEGKKAAMAEFQQKHGSNPETVTPRPTKFDRIVTDDSRKLSWQTAQGREQATRNRLDKYVSQVSRTQ